MRVRLPDGGRVLRGGLAEMKGLVHEVGRFGDAPLFNDHSRFDFACGNHLDVDGAGAEGFKQLCGHARVRAHSDADNGELCDAVLGMECAGADFFDDGLEGGLGLWKFVFGQGEGDVCGALNADILDDHVDDHSRRGQRRKNAGGRSGLVGDMGDGDFGLVFFNAHAPYHDGFHAFGFFFHNGSWVVVKAGAHLEGDAEFFREFHRAALHDLGAAGGHFEHFVVGYFLDFGGVFDNPRIAGVDAVDIGENLAEVRLDGGGDGNGGEVGPAAAEGGDGPLGGFALKPGDDDDVAFFESFEHAFRRNRGDFRLRVRLARDDARLGAREGDGFFAEARDGHRSEGDGGLFSGGQEDVHFTLARIGGDVPGQFDEVVGDAAHRGNNHDDLVALGLGFNDAARHVENAFGITDGSAAKFLDDECHGKKGR